MPDDILGESSKDGIEKLRNIVINGYHYLRKYKLNIY